MKKTITIISLFIAISGFSQQIGGGFAPDITEINDFTIPLKSGVYNGLNPIGAIQDASYGGWQHLFVTRHTNPNNNHELQIASSFAENDRLFFRKIASDLSPKNPAWIELATRGANTFDGNQTFNGNVGIGTTRPNSRLDLGSGYGINGAKLLIYNDDPTSELSGTKCGFYMDNFTSNNLNLVFPEATSYPGLFTISAKNTSNTILKPYFSIAGLTGNVGIGTTNPSEKLEIYNSDTTPAVISLKSSRNDFQFVDVGRISAKQASVEIARIGMPRSGGTNTGYLTFWTKADNNVDLTEKVRIAENGNVGIGTTNPTNKLDVNGTVHSKEVKVDMIGWSDFVFRKEYKLPTLEEVEKHIAEKGHLENIPSEEEVLKNGINLGEMNAKLLQKIEELTLYVIEMKKENIEMKLEIDKLKNK